ncbi:hypothetical protein [Roseivirga echinicomitans]|uniref:Uncharacterized protein n=1 Tax=Roseivirga echinicomitans TaxID=296218 RepID=A0A150X1M1_9BACT|nr:hypothetical protein [Roseivirga echinicomitans]KYG72462.1 hypothetical protein AWN68_11935 [Roseivirga echinicomitans]
MKKNIFLVVLLIACQMTKAQETQLTTNPEGQVWAVQELTKDEKTSFLTGVKNDSENLYLIFQTANQQSLNMVMQAGMSVKLKAKTKPKLNANIDYPLASKDKSSGTLRAQGSAEDKALLQEMLLIGLLDSKLDAKLKGFSSLKGTIGLNEMNDTQLILSLEGEGRTRLLSYELVLPLKELFDGTVDLNALSQSEIEIAFTVNAISQPQGGGGAQAGAGGRSGGGGRGGAGGGQGGAFSERGSMFSEQTVKIDYKLKAN